MWRLTMFTNDFVFGNNYERKETRDKFKPYIRCDRCIYSEEDSKIEQKYVRCNKYPNMLTLRDQTCKSAVLRK